MAEQTNPRPASEFRKRAIPPEFAFADDYRTIADNEARSMGFETCLPPDQRKQGLQGILIQTGGNGHVIPALSGVIGQHRS